MFISIIFGVFVAVWIEPVTALFPHLEDFSNPTEGGLVATKITTSMVFDDFGKQILTQEVLIGVVMFMILVCLWWWYGTFLGHTSPAKGFWLYLYDFITLCSFAVAFRLWYHPVVFPIIVVIAALLMLFRFGGVLFLVKDLNSTSRARKALHVAIGVLLAYVLVGIGVFVSPLLTTASSSEFMTTLIGIWPFYQKVVISLLFVGIAATVSAVLITEGRPFKFPREPEEWRKSQDRAHAQPINETAPEGATD